MPNVPPGIQTIPGYRGMPGVSVVWPGSSGICDVIISPSSCRTTGGRSNILITADLLESKKTEAKKLSLESRLLGIHLSKDYLAATETGKLQPRQHPRFGGRMLEACSMSKSRRPIVSNSASTTTAHRRRHSLDRHRRRSSLRTC